MNAAGEVIWEVRPTSEAAVAKGFANATKLAKLQAKLKKNAGDAGLMASVSLLEGMGRSQRAAPSMSDMEDWAKSEGIDKDVMGKFAAWNKEKKIARASRRPAAAYSLLKDGTEPEKGSPSARRFYENAARGAVDSEDAEIAAKAWKGFEPVWAEYLKANPSYAKNPRFKRTLDRFKKLGEDVKALQKDKGTDK